MSNISHRPALYKYGLLTALTLALAGPVAADPPCGSTLSGTTTLTGNVTCTAGGYILNSGATLDCNSFLLSGPHLSQPATCAIPTTPGCTTGNYGIRVNGQFGVTIKNCKVRQFERGLYATGMSSSVIQGNRFQNNTRFGAHVANDSQANRFEDNHYRQNKDEGIRLSDLTPGGQPNTFLRDQAYENISEGFYLTQAHEVVLTDIIARDNGRPGIYHLNTTGSVITNATIINDNVNILNDTGIPWVIERLEVGQ